MSMMVLWWGAEAKLLQLSLDYLQLPCNAQSGPEAAFTWLAKDIMVDLRYSALSRGELLDLRIHFI